MYAKNTEKLFSLNILEYSLCVCSDDMTMFTVADKFLPFLFCLLHVVLVVGTYQGITNHVLKR